MHILTQIMKDTFNIHNLMFEENLENCEFLKIFKS